MSLRIMSKERPDQVLRELLNSFGDLAGRLLPGKDGIWMR